MIYPHRIRLNGPWQAQPLEDEDAPVRGIRLPGDWRSALGKNFHGRVRFRRGFNRPTGLEAHERVWLVCPGGDASGQVFLNDQPLGQVLRHAVVAEFDITERLLPHNELRLDIDVPAVLPGDMAPALLDPEAKGRGPLGNIRLEVRLRPPV